MTKQIGQSEKYFCQNTKFCHYITYDIKIEKLLEYLIA